MLATSPNWYQILRPELVSIQIPIDVTVQVSDSAPAGDDASAPATMSEELVINTARADLKKDESLENEV